MRHYLNAGEVHRFCITGGQLLPGLLTKTINVFVASFKHTKIGFRNRGAVCLESCRVVSFRALSIVH